MRPPGLLAGRNDDTLPMSLFPGQAARITRRPGALGHERYDGTHPKLNRLLQREVHAIAATHRLGERDLERRFQRGASDRLEADDNGFTRNLLQPAVCFQTLAVEQTYGLTWPQSEHPNDMLGRACIQLYSVSLRQGMWPVDAGNPG